MTTDVYHVSLDRFTHDRLRNWARVMRDTWSRGHCRSIEWRYDRRSDPDIPKASGDLAARRRPIEVDIEDAWTVDRAIRGQTFPRRERALIESHYLHQHPYQRTCRVLSIPFRHYDVSVARAVLIVRNRLEVLAQ